MKILTERNPPTDDLSLPSYLHPEYIRRSEVWRLMRDCFRGRLNKVSNPETYLPREQNEPDDAYPKRLIRSPYENHTHKIITDYAGTINGLSFDGDLPAGIKSIRDNIDMRGQSLSTFCDEVDIKALRDLYCFILVDYNTTDPSNREEELQEPAQPFLRYIDARQVLNWEEDCGRIERVTIVEDWYIPSLYGAKCETVYRVIENDTWRVVRLLETDAIDTTTGKKIWSEQIVVKHEDEESEEVQEGQYLNVDGRPLGYCPIVPYTISHTDWTSDDFPAFVQVADLNVALYQSMSDWRAIVRSLCPVPWVRADDTARITNAKGYLSIGPHDFLDLGTTGTNACGYLQSDPNSVQPAYDMVLELRESIDRFSIRINEGKHQKTISEIRVAFLSIQEQISRYAKQKESVVNNIMQVIGDYLGIDSSSIPKASVIADVSSVMNDEKTIAILYAEGLISLESAVKRLHQLGFNSDVAEELLRLKSNQTNIKNAKINP